MGFDAGYGIGSVKPGVCTSSTRPASPFDGQVIYETDTNVVSVYDGAAWATVGPTTAGGLVFITGASFPAVGSVSLPADTFTATYENYLISLNLTANSNNGVAVSFRLRAAGADNTTTNYYWGAGGSLISAGTFFGMAGGGVTLGTVTNTDGGALVGGFIEVMSPKAATQTKTVSRFQGANTSGNFVSLSGSMAFLDTTSFDALTFLVATGTMTGQYRVYGYANS